MKIKKYQTPSTSIDYTDNYREVINNGVPEWIASTVESDLFQNNYYGAPDDYQFTVSPGDLPAKDFMEAYYGPNSVFLKAVGERQQKYFNKKKPIDYSEAAEKALKNYNKAQVVNVNFPYSYSYGYPGTHENYLYLGTLPDWPTRWPKEFVYGHEADHLTKPYYGQYEFLNRYQRKLLGLNTNTVVEGDAKGTKHDSQDIDKKADLHGIKAQLYKMGLFDPSKDTEISKEAIQKLREAYPDLRPLKQMNDEQLYFMLNHIAYNNTKNINNYA